MSNSRNSRTTIISRSRFVIMVTRGRVGLLPDYVEVVVGPLILLALPKYLDISNEHKILF